MFEMTAPARYTQIHGGSIGKSSRLCWTCLPLFSLKLTIVQVLRRSSSFCSFCWLVGNGWLVGLANVQSYFSMGQWLLLTEQTHTRDTCRRKKEEFSSKLFLLSIAVCRYCSFHTYDGSDRGKSSFISEFLPIQSPRTFRRRRHRRHGHSEASHRSISHDTQKHTHTSTTCSAIVCRIRT